jgi:tripartite-type tricarboxylate transporter receptor subunit TctC
MVTVVKHDAPWKSLRELIAEAKENPGKLSYSSTGYGGTTHFLMEMIKLEKGTDLNHVPMDGTGPQVAAVLGGHVNMTTAEVGLVHKHLEAKSLRALAVWAKKRDKLIPDVPTTAEEGFPTLLDSSWQAFFVPISTPDVIVKKLEKAFKETLNDKEIIETFEKAGWVIENLGSKETAEFVAKCQKKYVDVAKAINMVPK